MRTATSIGPWPLELELGHQAADSGPGEAKTASRAASLREARCLLHPFWVGLVRVSMSSWKERYEWMYSGCQ